MILQSRRYSDRIGERDEPALRPISRINLILKNSNEFNLHFERRPRRNRGTRREVLLDERVQLVAQDLIELR